MTHPFHPLRGRRFPLLLYRHNWGEHRVFFRNDQGQTCWLPAAWTSLGPADPFVVIAAGRAAFRVQDLLELARLAAAWRAQAPSRRRRQCQDNYAERVKAITPPQPGAST